MYIKQMQLCDTKARSLVDLRDYSTEIEKCVRRVMTDVDVEVKEKYFTIISHQSQTNSDAVKIGRHIGHTDLGKHTKSHIYKCSKTDSIRISNKIFIEVKKPKGKIIIDDGQKEREIPEVLAEMSDDKPVQEPCNYDEIPLEQLQHEKPILHCEYMLNECGDNPEKYLSA